MLPYLVIQIGITFLGNAAQNCISMDMLVLQFWIMVEVLLWTTVALNQTNLNKI